MAEHSKRAKERAKHKNPINFTCGICKQVHRYNKGYLCTLEESIETIEEEVI